MAVSQVRAADVYIRAAQTAAAEDPGGREPGPRPGEDRGGRPDAAGPAVAVDISSRAREAAAGQGRGEDDAREETGGRVDLYV